MPPPPGGAPLPGAAAVTLHDPQGGQPRARGLVKNVEDFRKAAEQAEQEKQVLLLVQSPQATLYRTFPLA